MADDPKKRHVDAATISIQEYERRYLKSQLRTEFPNKSDREISQAITSCGRLIAPSEGRQKWTACVRAKLRK